MFNYIDYDTKMMDKALAKGRDHWLRFRLPGDEVIEAYVECTTEIGDNGEDSNDEPALLIVCRNGAHRLVGCTEILDVEVLEKTKHELLF